MGIVIGLIFALGCLSILAACTSEPNPRLTRLNEAMERNLRQAGVGKTSPAAFSAGCLVGALVVGLVFLGVSGAWPIALAFALITLIMPVVWINSRARKHRTELRTLWPDAIDTLVSSIRAGLSLPEALANLAEHGPVQLRGEFAAFAVDYAVSSSFENSLEAFKRRSADPVADRIAQALALAHEVGGNDLYQVLQSLSQMLRSDLHTRGELEARQSWTVNGAKVAVAAPWIVLLLLSTKPSAASAYATRQGALVLLIGALTCAGAYWLMLRLGRLHEEQRVR